ncbi:MAG: hypothetical protein V1977_02500 [Candidatus Diapherotrites archaeon]
MGPRLMLKVEKELGTFKAGEFMIDFSPEFVRPLLEKHSAKDISFLANWVGAGGAQKLVRKVGAEIVFRNLNSIPSFLLKYPNLDALVPFLKKQATKR